MWFCFNWTEIYTMFYVHISILCDIDIYLCVAPSLECRILSRLLPSVPCCRCDDTTDLVIDITDLVNDTIGLVNDTAILSNSTNRLVHCSLNMIQSKRINCNTLAQPNISFVLARYSLILFISLLLWFIISLPFFFSNRFSSNRFLCIIKQIDPPHLKMPKVTAFICYFL
jgi:hypothetical protein